MNDIRSLLEKLSNAHGVSGWEGSIQQIIREEITQYVDDVRIDSMGNLIATRKGEKPSIMVEAHMDEIGLMVKHVDEKGFIRFIRIGGWFDQTLLNQRILLHTKAGMLTGVIGCKPPHVMKEDERKKIIEARDMFIDIGCKSDKEALELGIIPGTPITIDRSFASLLGDCVTGKAFDDRVGIVVMIEALKRTKTKSTIYIVGTTQEEVGLKGAKTSAYSLNPDIAITSDVTIPGDHPGIDKNDSFLEIGKGPAVTIADASGRGIIVNPQVVNWLVNTAKEYGIDIQLDADDFGGTTNGMAIQLTRAGVHAAVVNVPTRYVHSPVEVVSLNDIEKAAELIARSLETASRYF